MSEVRYRRRLGWLRFDDSEFMQFVGALLASHIPLFDQLRLILARNDLEMSSQVVRLIHVLKIHELAPELMHLFKTIDDLAGRSLKNASLLALIRVRHEEIHPFLLTLIQAPGDSTYRITAAMILRLGGIIRPELVLPFLRMAEDPTELTEIRCHAIDGLLRHGGGLRVLPLVVPLLQDHSGQVRWTALRAFERYGNDLYVPVIQPMINDIYQGDDRSIKKSLQLGILAKQLLEKWASAEAEKPDNSV
jgi:HEAT repeat protein